LHVGGSTGENRESEAASARQVRRAKGESMEASEAILTRRSIRRYQKRPVSEETIDGLLRAAMAAPSAANQQPWQFVVIGERAVLDAIPSAHPHAAMAAQAPLAIVVCGDAHLAKHGKFWVQDCAAATENLLVQANAVGLGAVWCGVHPDLGLVRAVRDLLGLPGHVTPLSLIVIGHPDEKKPPADRFDASRVHRNRWSG
jgi:nitroreductase